MQILTIEQVKSQYPNEWVLLQVQEEENNRAKSGIVLLHGKDYLELCYKASEIAKHLLTTILFTGETSHNRKWLKAIHSKEQQKMI